MGDSKVTGPIICRKLVEHGENNTYEQVYVLDELKLKDGSHVNKLFSGKDVDRSSQVGSHQAFDDEASWTAEALEANADALREIAEAEGLDWLLQLLPAEEER